RSQGEEGWAWARPGTPGSRCPVRSACGPAPGGDEPLCAEGRHGLPHVRPGPPGSCFQREPAAAPVCPGPRRAAPGGAGLRRGGTLPAPGSVGTEAGRRRNAPAGGARPGAGLLAGEVKFEVLKKSLEQLQSRLHSPGGASGEPRGLGALLQPFVPSPVIEGYRNKSVFSVNRGPDGHPQTVGCFLRSPGGKEIFCVPADRLRALPASHLQVAQCYEAFLRQTPAQPGLSPPGLGPWRRLRVRTGLQGHRMAIVTFHAQGLSQVGALGGGGWREARGGARRYQLLPVAGGREDPQGASAGLLHVGAGSGVRPDLAVPEGEVRGGWARGGGAPLEAPPNPRKRLFVFFPGRPRARG
uniref:Uncharacterized protein n=1 Tax=Monodelphis domestica TaxID=13616 RepID=A0A5F8GWL4_MONDO